MLEFPKPLHKLYKFKWNEKLYVADLEECKALEIDELTWRVLDLCTDLTTDQIFEQLGEIYEEAEITQCLKALENLEKIGLLFGSSSTTNQPDSKPLKILALTGSTYGFADMTWMAIGAQVAHFHILEALTKFADVYMIRQDGAPEEVHLTSFNPNDSASLLKLALNNYDGILFWFPKDIEFLPILRTVQIPTIMPIYQERGEGAQHINTILRWYAWMRDYDAFVVPTPSVQDFYSQFVLSPSLFHIIPYGVDLEHFKPMDKTFAKRQVAEMLGRPEIAEKPVVGFLSRFHPEKGAGVYIKVAQMNPDYIFLVVVPSLGVYSLYDLPENLIYAGRCPRDELPLFYNAFDVHCFPTMVGWETFGIVVLEAMACGTVPIVPNFDGPPFVVGDAGIVVPAETFKQEIGAFAGYVDPQVISEAIRQILSDDEERARLSKRVRERAMQYSWEKIGQEYIKLFKTLKLKRDFVQRRHQFPIGFAPMRNGVSAQSKCISVLTNITVEKHAPLYGGIYFQTVEKGLALSLLKHHTMGEVEAIFLHIYQDRNKVKDVLHRARAFLDSSS